MVFLLSCGERVTTVLGEWQWVETTGGLLPARTPENTGNTARLSLTKDQWTYFENGLESEQFPIKLRRRSAGIIIDSEVANMDKIVTVLNENEISITYYGGPNTDCEDCAVLRFARAGKD